MSESLVVCYFAKRKNLRINFFILKSNPPHLSAWQANRLKASRRKGRSKISFDLNIQMTSYDIPRIRHVGINGFLHQRQRPLWGKKNENERSEISVLFSSRHKMTLCFFL